MATALKMPRLSKGMATGEVVEWRKSPGEPVREGETLLVVLSEKAEVEVQAPVSGILLQLAVSPGEEAPVGDVLAWIGKAGETLCTDKDLYEDRSAHSPADHQPEQQPDAGSSAPPRKVRASPAARRVAAEGGIALARISGSGPDGLVTESDVRQAIQGKPEASSADLRATGLPETGPEQGKGKSGGEIERVPLRGVRRVMARRMAMSASKNAAVTTIVDVDMAAVRDLRKRLPVTYTSIVARAAALALQQHPILNAFLEDEEIVFHRRVHMGVAVDASKGLLVVVVSDAAAKPLRQIDNELRQLVAEARTDRVDPASEDAPTFTVTNSGVMGSLLFTPIINPPQSATLGMGKVQDTAVVREGQIVVRPVMYLCLTYDHRLIEGAEAVTYLQTVKRLLEAPETLA